MTWPASAGYAEFRVVGILAIVTAAWSVFAAIRALRGEEDEGRYELILAGAVGRGGAVVAVLVALAVECLFLWAMAAAGFLLAGALLGEMTVGQSLLTAATLAAPAVVFAAVGALASQLAPTRRSAQAGGAAAVGVAVLLRIGADVGHGVGWMRWLTPIGWAEEVRPVTGAEAGGAAAVRGRCGRCRRRGRRGPRPPPRRGRKRAARRAVARSRMTLLGSPGQAAVRAEVPTLLAWAVSAGLFAVRPGGVRPQRRRGGRQGRHPHLRALHHDRDGLSRRRLRPVRAARRPVRREPRRRAARRGVDRAARDAVRASRGPKSVAGRAAGGRVGDDRRARAGCWACARGPGRR